MSQFLWTMANTKVPRMQTSWRLIRTLFRKVRLATLSFATTLVRFLFQMCKVLQALNRLIIHCLDLTPYPSLKLCARKGHGGKVKDQNGDEKDGYDETLGKTC
jgi:hypothetical protein